MLSVSDEAERLYKDMEDASVAFAYFDASDKLQLWNRAYEDLNFEIRDLLHHGAWFPDLLAQLLVRGQIEIPPGQHAEWIADRLRARRHGCTSFRVLSDGRTFLAQERRDAVGGTLGFWLDVSDLVAAEVFKPSRILCSHEGASYDPGLYDNIRSKLLVILGNLEFLQATTGSQTSLSVIADAASAARELRDLLQVGGPADPDFADDSWAGATRYTARAS